MVKHTKDNVTPLAEQGEFSASDVVKATNMDAASASSPPDPFDPASFRIDPASDAGLGVKKLTVHVPVRKPNRQDFFRTHPSQDYRMNAAVLELEEENEFYLVMPAIANTLAEEVRFVELRTCISRAGVVWLWPVPLPIADGRQNAWNSTKRDGAERAETRWIRMVANRGAGCYDILEAPASIGEPVWPATSFEELLRIGFANGRIISSMDHPVLKRLLGT